MCPDHHTLIDKPGAAEKYPDSHLAEWKRCHEAAIRTAGTLCSGTRAHALVVQAPIGGQPASLDPKTIPFAMLQTGLVLDEDIETARVDAAGHAPKSLAYWNQAITRVRDEVRFRQNRWQQQPRPLALFALADMPTLMALGYALGHAAAVSVFQFDPVPSGGSWCFPDPDAESPEYRVLWPDTLEGSIALVISVSGQVERNRVLAALPTGTNSIIEITVDEPTVDFVRGPKTLDEFARTFRKVVARLERTLTKSTTIHVFPAMPASLAITFGRFIKPKVSFPFQIYDAEGHRAPFAPAVSLPFLDQAPGVTT